MIELKSAVHGRFMLEVAKADADGAEIPGTRRLLSPWQDNLITNTGMDFIGGGGSAPFSFMVAVSVGSGATAPAFTDTALQARVATTSTLNTYTSGFTTSAPFYSWLRKEFQFNTGTAAGVLSELGITGSGGTPAYTGALIKDSGGSPTTVTVLSDEILIVTYERRTYATTADVVTTATIKGVSQTITIRPSQIGTSSGMTATGSPYWTDFVWGGTWYTGGSGVGPSTGVPSGTAQSYSGTGAASVDGAYVSGSYYRDQTMNLRLADAAGLTITGFKGQNSAVTYQIGFVPGVPKTNSETVALRLRMSWARYTP
jgi:hypothetical protein